MNRNYPNILSFIKRGRSVFVFGPRGTGKTYFLTRILKELNNTIFIDLLNKEIFQRYLTRPSLLYNELELSIAKSKSPLVVMIDEIQLLPNLLDEVHRSIENFKPRIVFILTGSSARKLKRENANLLAGRAIRIDFFPIGMDEIDFNINLPKLLHWGSLPEVVTTEDVEIKESYLRTYVGTYLDEEIKREAQIRNLAGFSRFLEIAAAENGQCVNYAKMGRAAGISDVTVKDYFEILYDTLIAYHIPAWSYSIREQLQQSPKYYLFDNGIVNALLGELKSSPNPATYRFGRLFENLVVGQLVRYRSLKESPANIYHYRTQTGIEIDLIVQKNPHSHPVAIEIKSADSPTTLDVRPLIAFREKYPNSSALVICRTNRSYQENGIQFLNLEDGVKKVFELADN
jgi:uncharacterized protein